MKKLSKKERHEIYKKAYQEFDKGCFLCHTIRYLTNGSTVTERKFPELFLFKDIFRSPSSAWITIQGILLGNDFSSSTKSGYKVRKTVLALCIEMTRP